MNDLDREILKLAEKPEMCREARALILAAGAMQSGKTTLGEAVKLLMEPEMPLESRLILLGEELPTEAGEYYFKGYCSCEYAFSEFPTWCHARVFMNDKTQRLNCEVTREHDDTHTNGEMSGAAACYAIAANELSSSPPYLNPPNMSLWAWDFRWWKPGRCAIRCLVKAGALIAAEIDRLQRLNSK